MSKELYVNTHDAPINIGYKNLKPGEEIDINAVVGYAIKQAKSWIKTGHLTKVGESTAEPVEAPKPKKRKAKAKAKPKAAEPVVEEKVEEKVEEPKE
jgi:hypothetical protein